MPGKVIIKQMILTVYSDGSTKCTERTLPERDGKSGRYKKRDREIVDPTPYFEGFEPNKMKGN